MKKKIKIIREKLKTDTTRVAFYVPGPEIFLKIQKVLLDNGYFWRGQQLNAVLPSQYDSYTRQKLVLFINHDGREPKNLSLTTDPTHYELQCDIFLDVKNIDEFVRLLFLVEPDYSPKKIIKSLEL